VFVITADQIDSRSHPDRVATALQRLNSGYPELALPPERTAGDEFQTLVEDSATALSIVLDLHRDREWSIGVGCGGVRHPLPPSIREATGGAFFAARTAVARAKHRNTRFALTHDATSATSRTADAEALIDLLLLLRDRRTTGGWELHDLLATGMNQQEAAVRLGISEAAVSSRARSAGIRAEEAAVPALATLLARLDDDSTGSETT